MAELLLELLSEEIPARMQARAAGELERLVRRGLADAGLEFESARAFATPRRLTVVVDGLPERQPDVREERRGPRADAPEKAVEGFLRSAGIARDQAEVRETDKGTFLFAVIEREGRDTAEVLGDVLPEAIAALSWPKSMRWGSGAERWVRPLHTILCLLDGAVVPFRIGTVTSGRETSGHRFHGLDTIPVKDFADYERRLREGHVILDPAERRQRILEGARKLAADEGLALVEDEGLLDEVTGLVEWPVVLMGGIDEAFMALPPEVLTTAMRAHQKYFSLQGADGALAPRFVTVANIEARDGGKEVVAGNERVLRARLADARFFWDQDCKAPLESRVPALDGVIFHAKLGSLGDKVTRLQALAAELVPSIPGADADRARSAALLCKADLVTGMVGEFPELQGIMGRYYALEEGEKPEVGDAIAEHYAPLGPSDRCPTAPTSVAVALADKIDTLVGFFAIGETPTGSKDPFALRRAALGVIRIVLENGLRLSLGDVFDRAAALYADGAVPTEALLAFFADRLKVHLRERGVRHDLIDAVFALSGEDDLVRLLARVDALGAFLESDDGANLLTAYKRATNIVRIEEKNDGRAYSGALDEALLRQPEEAALAKELDDVSGTSAEVLAREDFVGAMAALARLRTPVDAFFDEVTVNTDDKVLRENRLHLLARIRATLGAVADFSRIEG